VGKKVLIAIFGLQTLPYHQYIARVSKKIYFSLCRVASLAKSSCGGSPVHLHHEIEKRKKKKRNHAYNVMSSDVFQFFLGFFLDQKFWKIFEELFFCCKFD
jgi:hypothetical protein